MEKSYSRRGSAVKRIRIHLTENKAQAFLKFLTPENKASRLIKNNKLKNIQHPLSVALPPLLLVLKATENNFRFRGTRNNPNNKLKEPKNFIMAYLIWFD
jgi:hypothetical protein